MSNRDAIVVAQRLLD